MRHIRSMEVNLPEGLPAYTADEVATTVLFHGLVAFRARFGVYRQPVYSLGFVLTFLVPELPHETRAWRMRLGQAVEAELLPANTLYLTIGFTFNPNCIPTVRNAGAPLHLGVILNVGLQKKALVSID